MFRLESVGRSVTLRDDEVKELWKRQLSLYRSWYGTLYDRLDLASCRNWEKAGQAVLVCALSRQYQERAHYG